MDKSSGSLVSKSNYPNSVFLVSQEFNETTLSQPSLNQISSKSTVWKGSCKDLMKLNKMKAQWLFEIWIRNNKITDSSATDKENKKSTKWKTTDSRWSFRVKDKATIWQWAVKVFKVVDNSKLTFIPSTLTNNLISKTKVMHNQLLIQLFSLLISIKAYTTTPFWMMDPKTLKTQSHRSNQTTAQTWATVSIKTKLQTKE